MQRKVHIDPNCLNYSMKNEFILEKIVIIFLELCRPSAHNTLSKAKHLFNHPIKMIYNEILTLFVLIGSHYNVLAYVRCPYCDPNHMAYPNLEEAMRGNQKTG